MANPDIQLMGATYQAVSGVTLPTSGGGTATFPFVEGSQTITQNGTVDVTSLAQVIVNVAGGGGGGLTYETGTYTPASNIAKPTISFANAHTGRPICVILSDTETTLAPTDSTLYWGISSFYDAFGTPFKYTNSASQYARVMYGYKTSSGCQHSGFNVTSLTGGTNSTDMPYHLTNTGFTPYLNSTSRYFLSSRTYKWIAVWAPTT